MLFVSKKEPLTTETLPDTSLHNARLHSSNSSCSSADSTAFFCPSNACLPKLTREQLDLHREFLRLGSLLMNENADLFHQALTLLSAKHTLKVATPATCVSDIIPPARSSSCSSSCKTNDSDGVDEDTTTVECGNFATPRASSRKYVLPEDVASREFYQCMVCKERRTCNSFGAAHTHEGQAKPSIRWYCPLCDQFFAVTHRCYHIRNRHSDIVTVLHPQPSSVEQKPAASSVVAPATLKRARDLGNDEEDHESAFFSPPEKMRPSFCESPSAVSTASASMASSCFSHEEPSQEEECCSSGLGSLPDSPFSQEAMWMNNPPLLCNQEDTENEQEDHLFYSVPSPSSTVVLPQPSDAELFEETSPSLFSF